MEDIEYISEFEKKVGTTLRSYLLSIDAIDERMPDMPDVEEQWRPIAEAYMPDGIREFNGYPLVSLGWMMFVGMAVASLWDTDWESALKHDNIYVMLRDMRGYDCMDEAIREDVLNLSGEGYRKTEKIVADCSQQVLNLLRHEQIEPGSPMAYRAYIASLRQLYLFGAAIQLYAMGYKMQKM